MAKCPAPDAEAARAWDSSECQSSARWGRGRRITWSAPSLANHFLSPSCQGQQDPEGKAADAQKTEDAAGDITRREGSQLWRGLGGGAGQWLPALRVGEKPEEACGLRVGRPHLTVSSCRCPVFTEKTTARPRIMHHGVHLGGKTSSCRRLSAAEDLRK